MHGDSFADFAQCSPWLMVPDPCVLVTLPGGLELTADPGQSQAEFTLAGWSGWDEGPEPSGGAVPWGTEDDGIEGDVIFQGRNLEFNGLIVGRSPQQYWELRQELGAVLTRARWGVLQVDEEHLGLYRQVRVARGGRPVFGNPMSDRVGSYQVQFQSATHLLSDIEEQSATIATGGTSLQNVGNADAYPVVSLVGPLTNPGLTWPGGVWTYNATIPSGTTITVEMDRRRVRNLATTAHSANVVSGSVGWLSLPPGTTTVKRTGTGSGSITAKWRSTWS